MPSRGAANTGKFIINMNRFEGGMSTDMKNSVQNGYWDSEGLDARTAPSQMTVLPRFDTMKNTDGTNPITDLILDVIQDQTGTKWAIGKAGNLYKIDTSNQITLVGTIPEPAGGSLVYNQLSDMLYVPGQQSISTYGPLTGYSGTNTSIQPAWHYNVWGKSASTYNGVVNLYDVPTGTYSNHARNNLQTVGAGAGITNVSQVGAAPGTIAGTGTPQYSYTNVIIPSTIDESQANKTAFIPDIEPFYSIAVYIVNKGAGDLTLTLHDTYNNAVAAVTIPNAQITENAYNEFVFNAPGVRSYTGATAAPQNGVYHFHLTSSVAANSVNTNMMPNGDFSNGTTGWAGLAGTIAVNSTTYHSSPNSMTLTNSRGGHGADSPSTHFTAGHTYQVSAWVYPTASGQQVRIENIQSTNGNFLEPATNYATLNSSSWNLISATYTATQTGGGVRIYSSRSEDYYIDDISIVDVTNTYLFRSVGSTVAVTNGGYQQNSTTADMTGVDFILFVDRMVKQNNGLHPMTLFNANLCIGNGPYLSTYNMSMDANPDNSVYVRSAWSMDAGYECCGFAVLSQYLAVFAERRRSGGNQAEQDGMIYFWDGTSQAYNIKVHVPQGSPSAPQVYDNVLYYTVNGSLYAIAGVGQPSMKVRLISYQNGNYSGKPDNTIMYPNLSTIRNTELLIAYPGQSDNPNVRYGVYSWGNVEMIYPSSFGRSYMLDANGTASAIRTTANQLQMGCLANFVDAMYLSWGYKDANGTAHYGLDYLDNASKPARNFSWASLIYDGGSRYKQKRMLRYKINFEPLVAGQKVYAWHSINRGQPVITNSASVGDTQLFVELPRGRFHEAQWGFYGTNDDTVTIPEQFTGNAFEIDPLNEEIQQVADDGRDDYTPINSTITPPVGAIVGATETEEV